MVIQAPDFQDRIWIHAPYAVGIDHLAAIGMPYETRSGACLGTGQMLQRRKPDAIQEAIHSSTTLANAIRRALAIHRHQPAAAGARCVRRGLKDIF